MTNDSGSTDADQDPPTGRRAGANAPLTYRDAGVSIEAGAALVDRIGPSAARTRRPGVVGGLGGFGALFDLQAAGYDAPLLVAATDGVGTKLAIGIETGRVSGLGVDLVAMCVNDLLCQGAEPLFFLDYFATGALDPSLAAEVIEGVVEGCADAGCALVGGETAEMPGLYKPGDFDLAGFAVGAVERDRVLPRPVDAGDVILGIASAGAHANGFSLIRKLVARAGLSWDAQAPFAPEQSLGAALLTPTRIYTRSVLATLSAHPPNGPGAPDTVKALAHVTGGGLTENLPRALTEGAAAEIDLDAWPRGPLFDWLAAESAAGPEEMLKTFNCGIGLCVVTAAHAADAVAATLRAAGETVWRIGAVRPREKDGAPIRYRGAF